MEIYVVILIFFVLLALFLRIIFYALKNRPINGDKLGLIKTNTALGSLWDSETLGESKKNPDCSSFVLFPGKITLRPSGKTIYFADIKEILWWKIPSGYDNKFSVKITLKTSEDYDFLWVLENYDPDSHAKAVGLPILLKTIGFSEKFGWKGNTYVYNPSTSKKEASR